MFAAESRHTKPASPIGRDDLKSCSFFMDLPGSCLDRILAGCLAQRFDSGTLVLGGEIAAHHDVFAVLDGSLEVLVAVNGHPESRVAELGAGDIFGYFSAVAGIAGHARVLARTEARLAVIPRLVFVELVQSEPELAYRLANHLVEIIRRLNGQLAVATQKSQDIEQLYRNLIPHCL